MSTTTVGKLVQEELNEVLIRHQALMNAKASYLMMQRGYHEYISETLSTWRHNPKDNLQLDLRSGEVRLVTDADVDDLEAIASAEEKKVDPAVEMVVVASEDAEVSAS